MSKKKFLIFLKKHAIKKWKILLGQKFSSCTTLHKILTFSSNKNTLKKIIVPVCTYLMHYHLRKMPCLKVPFNLQINFFTYIEESAGGEGKDPGGSGLQGLDRVQGERGQCAQHPQAGRPHLGLPSLPSNQCFA